MRAFYKARGRKSYRRCLALTVESSLLSPPLPTPSPYALSLHPLPTPSPYTRSFPAAALLSL
jgi:hypothetical protein